MKLTEIETPALVVDLDEVEYNIAAMKELLKDSGAALRPHFKTSKSVCLAKMQMAAGAKGMTCAKLSEAEVLAEAGIPDILIANQVVQPSKLNRLAFLAKKTRLTVCVDDAGNIAALEKAAEAADSLVHVYIEYEMGMNRCGVETPEEVLGLAEQIRACSHLSFDGIQAYAGWLSHEEDENFRKEKAEEAQERLRVLKAFLEQRGIGVKEISGCSTGTVQYKARGGIYTELQCGSYLLSDTSYQDCKVLFHNALYLLSTVVSRKADRLILDVGVKGMGMDQKQPRVLKYPKSILTFSEEHLALSGEDYEEKRGDQLLVVPGHCCTTMNLYDTLYLKRGDEVLEKIAIEGRGKSI